MKKEYDSVFKAFHTDTKTLSLEEKQALARRAEQSLKGSKAIYLIMSAIWLAAAPVVGLFSTDYQWLAVPFLVGGIYFLLRGLKHRRSLKESTYE